MPYTKVIFSAIIGAIIGYITNWLAIKMLFRPHTEKRIFGIKVPFTPGLIPKEKNRIAKSTAEAIGSHLLTNDTMVEALRKNGLDEKFKAWVGKKILEIVKSPFTVKQQGEKILGDKFTKLKDYIKDNITKLMLSIIRKDKLKQELEDLIVNELKKEFSKNPKILLESSYYNSIKSNIIGTLDKYKSSEEFKKAVEKVMWDKISELENMDKTLNEVIPEGVISTFKVYIYSKNHDIAMAIKTTLKDEKTQEKIKKALGEMISNNVNSVLAMFLNPDTIYSKFLPAVESYLDEEDTQKELAIFINDIIDKALQNKLSDILLSLPEEAKENNAKYFSDAITSKFIDDKLVRDIVGFFEGKVTEMETLEAILKRVNIDLEKTVRDFISKKISYILEREEIEEKVEKYTEGFIEDFLNLKLSYIFQGKEDKISKISSNIAEEAFERFLTRRAGEFMEAFDIRKIVEDKINSFEVSFAEEIILEISKRELNAITWLGALLGFIMGLVSSILAAL